MMRILLGLMSVFFFVAPRVVSAQGAVVYEIAGMDQVTVRTVEYRVVDGTPFMMDVYYPPDMADSAQLPVVIFVNGFRDSRIRRFTGIDHLKDVPSFTSWGRLVAASGLIGVTFESEQPDDLETLIAFIRENADSLQIDGDNIGLHAVSSNPPTAISYAMQDGHDYIKVAVFYYGSMVTPDGQFTSAVDHECREFGCYGPSELAPIEQLRNDLPTLIVRTGHDNGENPQIDHYVAQAIESNVPLTFINFPAARHGFDTNQTERILADAQAIVAYTIDFMISHLSRN